MFESEQDSKKATFTVKATGILYELNKECVMGMLFYLASWQKWYTTALQQSDPLF